MSAINLLLQIIFKNYIINTSWNNCILHFTSADQEAVTTHKNITSYHFTNSSYFIEMQERCDCIIIWDTKNTTQNFTETILESIDTQLQLQNMRFRYNNRKFIVVTDRNDDSINLIFATKSLHFVVDFLLLSLSDPDGETHNVDNERTALEKFMPSLYINCSEIKLLTHKYVGADGGQPLLLDTYDSCTKSFRKNANLFPDKLTNQYGRPLKMHTAQMETPRVNISNQNIAQ